VWAAKQTLSVWNEKSLKELKMIKENWTSTSYEKDGVTVWTNPLGNPYDNAGYFTQKEKFFENRNGQNYAEAWNSYWRTYHELNPIEADLRQYSWWEMMHQDVTWFDTAGCFKGKFVGEVNNVKISAENNNTK